MAVLAERPETAIAGLRNAHDKESLFSYLGGSDILETRQSFLRDGALNVKTAAAVLTFVGVVALVGGCTASQAQEATLIGNVDRGWEDGFQLNASNRSITVDAYNLCGDNTASSIAVDEEVTVTGEFEGREFDAFSIENSSGDTVCNSQNDYENG